MSAWIGTGLPARPPSLRALLEATVRHLVQTVDCTAESIAAAAVDILQQEFTVPNKTLLQMLMPQQDQWAELGTSVIDAACLRVLIDDEDLVHAHFHALLALCRQKEHFKMLVKRLYTSSTLDLDRQVYDAEIARCTKLEVVLLGFRRQWKRKGGRPRRSTEFTSVYDAEFIAAELNGLYSNHDFYGDIEKMRLRARNGHRRILGNTLRQRLGRVDPFRLAEKEEDAG